jgi:hypothetical protein
MASWVNNVNAVILVYTGNRVQKTTAFGGRIGFGQGLSRAEDSQLDFTRVTRLVGNLYRRLDAAMIGGGNS